MSEEAQEPITGSNKVMFIVFGDTGVGCHYRFHLYIKLKLTKLDKK